MLTTENEAQKDRQLTLKYSLVQGFFWMQYAGVIGFNSIFLLSRGFHNTQIGIIFALAGTLSALMQPVVAGYADRPDSPSLKRIVAVLASVLLGMGAALIFVKRGLVLCGLLYGGCICVLQLLTPLVNALGMESINQGREVNFGLARGTGSALYAVIAYVLGILVDRAGTDVIPLAIVAVFLCFLLALRSFPFRKMEKPSAGQAKQSRSPLAFFKRYKRFSIVLVGCVLVYVSHMLVSNFTYQIVEAKGGGSVETGFIMAFAAILELPTMFLFTHMVKKVRCDIWFRISGIFFMLKALGTLLAPSIPVLYAVQAFQIFGFALITVSSVYYVNSIMEEQDVIKGQACITMTHTLGCVLGALTGGLLIDWSGVKTMLVVAAAAAALGMGIMLFATERGKNARQ